jgi:hypothetical protein
MEPMIIEYIEDDMGCLAPRKGFTVWAIAKQVKPIIYRGRLNRRKSDLPVAGGEKRMNE